MNSSIWALIMLFNISIFGQHKNNSNRINTKEMLPYSQIEYKVEGKVVSADEFNAFCSVLKLIIIDETYVCKKTTTGGNVFYNAKSENGEIYCRKSVVDNKKGNFESIIKETKLKSTKNIETTTLKGKIIAKNFINKINKKFNYIEYYFETEESSTKMENYFIKGFENKITKADLNNLINQIIIIKAIVKNGLWDTNDPMVQSRIGNYIILVEILKN